MICNWGRNVKRSAAALARLTACAFVATAANASEPPADQVPENFRANIQSTVTVQGYPRFSGAYSGRNSLPLAGQTRESVSITGFIGVRMPWAGGEFYFNPEYFQGAGLHNTRGIAGFPNGDAQKIGLPEGSFYMARAFLRQTFALGAETEWTPGGPNQLAGFTPTRRVVLTIGRMAVMDHFQTSAYAGDPRRQFSNWSVWAPGAWDIPADARGYTDGVVVEAALGAGLAFRYGVFAMPAEPNGLVTPIRANNLGHAVELSFQHALFGRPGTVKPLAFVNTGAMGRYREALDLAGATGLSADEAMARTRRFGNLKWGVALLVDQELADHVGAFLRASWNDGRTETYAFTQIDRSVAVGVSFKGALWDRPGHSAGVAVAQNDLSRDHARFLASGGTGIIIGDGALRYGSERVVEAFYDLPIYRDNVFLAGQYQLIHNPGYNRDRAGPAHVIGMRLHARY